MTFHSLDFRRTATLLAKRFGNLNLGIDPAAQSLQNMLPVDGTHRPLVHSILQEIYQQNGCSSLDAMISLDPTFDALGKLAWVLKSAGDTDVDALTLIEQIGEYLAELFIYKCDEEQQLNPHPSSTKSAGSTIHFHAPR